jgi:hypothetical protein
MNFENGLVRFRTWLVGLVTCVLFWLAQACASIGKWQKEKCGNTDGPRGYH